MSDHCAVAMIRNCKPLKTAPRIIEKRYFKNFDQQAFLHDLHHCDWQRVSLVPDVQLAWTFFKDLFLSVVQKHAPLKRFRVKGRENPWFSDELSCLIRERDHAWAKARKSRSELDWIRFRYLRNKCTTQIRKAKSQFYLDETTRNLQNPAKFWKTIKSIKFNSTSSALPKQICSDSAQITDKKEIVDAFNQHFASAGLLFNSQSHQTQYPQSPTMRQANRPTFTLVTIHRE